MFSLLPMKHITICYVNLSQILSVTVTFCHVCKILIMVLYGNTGGAHVWIMHVMIILDHFACHWCMFEICCVLQGMIGGYPPVLPPLQGPVDGIVSMSSMQSLHPGVPPPHQLPPGMPGIPPPGKNDLLIHSLSHHLTNFCMNDLHFLLLLLNSLTHSKCSTS